MKIFFNMAVLISTLACFSQQASARNFEDYEVLATSGSFKSCGKLGETTCYSDAYGNGTKESVRETCEKDVSDWKGRLVKSIADQNVDMKTNCSEVLTLVNISDNTFSDGIPIVGNRYHIFSKLIDITIYCKPRPLSETVLASLVRTCAQTYSTECAGYIKRLDAVRPTKFPVETNGSCR